MTAATRGSIAAVTAVVSLLACARGAAPVDAAPDAPWPRIDPARVARFVLASRGRGEIVLERRGDGWWMTRPFPGPAARSYVTAALAQLADARPAGRLARAAAGDEPLGLDPAHALEVRLEGAGHEGTATLRVGAALARGGTAVQVGATVYRVDEALRPVLEAPARDWRERTIADVPDPVAIEWRSAAGLFRFERTARGWASITPLVCFAPWRMEPLVRDVATLRAADFALPEAATGIAPDGPGVTVVGASGARVVLRFGRRATPDTRYVQREGDPSVYTVTLSRGRLDFDPASVQDCGAAR